MKPPIHNNPIYGWRAPISVNSYGLLVAFLAGSSIALILSNIILSLFWGEPTADPLIDPVSSRIGSIAGIALLGGLMIKPEWRSAAASGITVLFVASLGPWHSPFHFVQTLTSVLRRGGTGHIITVMTSLAVGVGLAGILAHNVIHLRRLKRSGVRGSTEWGDGADLKDKEKGFILGRSKGKMLRYDGSGHLITIAATRSGKGVGTIIPNLLDHPGSVVVTDPKGENYAVTADHRRDTLKHTVIAMDPFKISDQKEVIGFNPVDLIDTTTDDYVETATNLADMIISHSGGKGDPHWIMEGRALLFTFILHVAGYKKDLLQDRHLIEVRRLLTLEKQELDDLLQDMLSSQISQVREGAGRILQKANRERSGVFSTAQSYTHFLSSPRMKTVLTQTDFSLQKLKDGKLSLYLILPRQHLTTFAAWMRLMISCCYHVCTYTLEKPRERILFLLDEFANLGYMSNIKEAVSLGGGYGVSMWLILQDMAQLKLAYRNEWESFVANSDVLQAFAIQDPFTTEKIAKMLGQTTVWQRRMRRSSRREGSTLIHDYDEDSRPLLRQAELRRLHPDRQILLIRPYQPIAADKIRYYQDGFFAGRYKANPLYK